ncbi:hypothetical protein MXB_854 [Myxobolus squamalis]|nr:hypothetical protein MXB_854 [Myxobolus squamalis]
MRGEADIDHSFYYNKSAVALDDEGKKLFVKYCSLLLPLNHSNAYPIHACCSTDQLTTLKRGMAMLESLIPNCGICRENIQLLTCHAICDPNQATFSSVSLSKIDPAIVDSLVVSMTYEMAKGIYNSCKDVKFPNSLASITSLICSSGHGKCNAEKFIHSLFSFSWFNVTAKISYKNNTENLLNGIPLACNKSYRLFYRNLMPCSCQDCDSSCSPLPEIEDKILMTSNYFTSYQFIILCCYVGCMILYIAIISFSYFNICPQNNYTKNFNNDAPEVSNNKKINKKIEIINFNTFEREINNKIKTILQQWGLFVSKNKIFVSFCSITIIVVLSCGTLYNFTISSDPVEIWSPPNGQFRKHKQYFEENFGPFFRIEQILVRAPKLNQQTIDILGKPVNIGPIFNIDIIKEIFKIQNDIQNLISFVPGDNFNIKNNVTLGDLCYKPLEPLNSKCVFSSITQYFQNNLDSVSLKSGPFNWLTHIYYCLNSPGSIKDNDLESLPCLSDFKAPINPKIVLGGYESNPNEASAFVITYVLKNEVDTKFIEAVRAWEKSFLEYLTDYSHPLIEISYSSERSIQDEIDRQTHTEFFTVTLSYFLMFIYVAFTLGKINTNSLKEFFVDQKFFLGFMGVVLVILSVLASIGFYCYFNFKVNMIVLEVLPFLALAIGVDNIFLMVHEFERIKSVYKSKLSVYAMIAEMMGNVGHGMIVCAVAQITTFSIGSISNIPAVRSFSLFAAAAISINFLMQMTLFLVIFTLEAIREEKKIPVIFCCFNLSYERISDNQPNIIERIFKILSKVILNKWVKPIIFILFVNLWFVSLYYIPSIKIGLDQTSALPLDSYLHQYYDNVFKFLKSGPPTYFVVSPGYKYEEKYYQNLICANKDCSPNSLTSTIYHYSRISKNSKIATGADSWLDTYLAWLKSHDPFPCCQFKLDNRTNEKIFCPSYISENDLKCQSCFNSERKSDITPTQEEFSEYLPWFLQDIPAESCPFGGKPLFEKNVALNPKYYIDKNKSELPVLTSAFLTYHTSMGSSEEIITALVEAVKISKNISSNINHNERVGAFIWDIICRHFCC